ncbi:ribosome biogenesis protein [Candidatus Micrarchaeota archaeon CG10_big_fil_rev_8_21_14_0_10_45_29]|nr:MAG: ribosome biogenesis protein [Candidatus Micrarchaeota archaeon CG10_big_fil_rev_8_21_14_0_10_45_29]
MPILRKCKNRYTLQKECENPHPPKFNPKDMWGKYRRKAKGIE